MESDRAFERGVPGREDCMRGLEDCGRIDLERWVDCNCSVCLEHLEHGGSGDELQALTGKCGAAPT